MWRPKPRTVRVSSWAAFFVVLLFAVGLMVAASDLNDFWPVVAFVAFVPPLSVATFAQALFLSVNRKEYPTSAWLPWTMQVGVLVFLLWAAMTNFPFRARFDLSRSAFDAAATRSISGQVVKTPVSLGLIRVSKIETDGGTVSFHVGEAGLLGSNNIVYGSSKRPQAGGDVSYDHLQGPWWLETVQF